MFTLQGHNIMDKAQRRARARTVAAAHWRAMTTAERRAAVATAWREGQNYARAMKRLIFVIAMHRGTHAGFVGRSLH